MRMLKDPAQLRMDLEECLNVECEEDIDREVRNYLDDHDATEIAELDEEEMIELANFLGVKYY
jgi:hypothetical protein